MRTYARPVLLVIMWMCTAAFYSGNSRMRGNAASQNSNLFFEVEQTLDITSHDGSSLRVSMRGRYRFATQQELGYVAQTLPGEVREGHEFTTYLKYLGGKVVQATAIGEGHTVTIYDCSQQKKVYWQGAGHGTVEDKLAGMGRIHPRSGGRVLLEMQAGDFSPYPCDGSNANTDKLEGMELAFACGNGNFPSAEITYKELHDLDKINRTWTGPASDIVGCVGNATTHIRAVGSEDVELVLIRPVGYDQWMPKGGLDEDHEGNQLRVKVELRKKGTNEKPFWTTVDKFTFKLTETSKEPGTCLNWPPPDQTKTPADFDLKIDNYQNPDLQVADDHQSGTSKKKDLQQMTIWISSYDWGAWGKLTVSADLSNGETNVQAHLEGKPDVKELSIPKDDDGNHVADAWDVEGTKPKAESDDDDSPENRVGSAPDKPQGDGHKGDVLSYYEEYRGFHIAGAGAGEGRTIDGDHVRTDPKRKDVFIYDKNKLGVGYFGESGMAFHVLNENEFTKVDVNDPKQENPLVANFNYKFAHLGGDKPDVHVIKLIDGPAPDDPFRLGETVPGPGTPKHIVGVFINASFARLAGQASGFGEQQLRNTIAHELAHSCNVQHHGDGDYTVTEVWKQKGGLWVPLLAPCGISGKGVPITDCEVAAKGGEHSGSMQCVMRYFFTTFYEFDGGQYRWRNTKGDWQQGERSVPRTERPGNSYCNSKDGDPPNPRLGKATRGNCKVQFCVNDLMH